MLARPGMIAGRRQPTAITIHSEEFVNDRSMMRDADRDERPDLKLFQRICHGPASLFGSIRPS